MTKIAITLPDEQVEAAREAVLQGRAPSVSAYISATLAIRREDESLTWLLADMAVDAGTSSSEDRRWARYALGLD